MSNGGVPIMTEQFKKDYIRTLTMSTMNAEKVINALKHSKDVNLRGLAKHFEEQIKEQGGY